MTPAPIMSVSKEVVLIGVTPTAECRRMEWFAIRLLMNQREVSVNRPVLNSTFLASAVIHIY